MRCIRAISLASTAAFLICASLMGRPVPAKAETANGLSLLISQLKITSSSGQFVTLYNATDATLDMSRYQLEYFNSYDLSKATTSRLITLAGTLPPHGYYMVNDSSLLLCYQQTVNSVSLGFSSTAGLVEVLASNQSSPGGPVVPLLQDYVGWSKTSTAGAQTLPADTNAFLRRLPLDANNNPSVAVAGAGNWQTVQPDTKNPCNLVTGGTLTPVGTGLNQLLPGSEPPATISPPSGEAGTEAVTPMGLPSADIGLMAPQISELLPNPDGTGNDTSDEYIELYNPNDKTFDLSGFSLQTGLASFHTYAIPAGTMLEPHSWKAYYSETTGLSLSNSGSIAKLIDPTGNSISASADYSGAKDGQAWALAKGKWYWTLSPTPGSANVIKQPAAKKTASAKAKPTPSKTSAVKSGKANTSVKSGASGAYAPDPATAPIHYGVLVLVAGLALVYGVYEYRVDLANRIHRLRRHFADRRPNWPKPARWRADRAKG